MIAESIHRLAIVLNGAHLAQCPVCRGDCEARHLPWWEDADLLELYGAPPHDDERLIPGDCATGRCPVCGRDVDLEWMPDESEPGRYAWTAPYDRDAPVVPSAPAMVRRAQDGYLRARSAYLNSYRHQSQTDTAAALASYRNAEAQWRRALERYEDGDRNTSVAA